MSYAILTAGLRGGATWDCSESESPDQAVLHTSHALLTDAREHLRARGYWLAAEATANFPEVWERNPLPPAPIDDATPTPAAEADPMSYDLCDGCARALGCRDALEMPEVARLLSELVLVEAELIAAEEQAAAAPAQQLLVEALNVALHGGALRRAVRALTVAVQARRQP